ncbi:MAG: hypothetical protein CMN80_08890 [Spongiibacter sp.]|uniref:hypothetical protein n=1 Tax=Spongiibacter sp. TaxID=2024860 RepID=UPI000C0BA20F|nr:hypothetical protein [Spongiibacter sp.]MAK44250.1 hypothetical protein [Spongiibacter sp.]|tara:strand:- start:78 stop:527 length:450 start_codon:yes stop_codon:yes gene_type:complete
MKSTIGIALLLLAAGLMWFYYQQQACCVAPLEPLPMTEGKSSPGVTSNPPSQKQATKTADGVPTAPPLDSAPPLDLRLPTDYTEDATPFEPQTSRYGVERWFEEGDKPESKLKLKSKIYLKEDATLDKSFNAYDEKVDGVEMGFEYKTP